jgi:hypothetical protein
MYRDLFVDRKPIDYLNEPLATYSSISMILQLPTTPVSICLDCRSAHFCIKTNFGDVAITVANRSAINDILT